MKLNLVIALLVIVLLLVFYQDLKRRTIHVVLPILIFCIGLTVNYLSLDLNFIDLFYNLVFVLINIIGLVLYFSIKSKKMINPIDRFIGLGDVVFFFAITPLFKLRSYILFFILGLAFSLIIHIIYSNYVARKTIPLAGYLSFFLILNVVFKSFFNLKIIV